MHNLFITIFTGNRKTNPLVQDTFAGLCVCMGLGRVGGGGVRASQPGDRTLSVGQTAQDHSSPVNLSPSRMNADGLSFPVRIPAHMQREAPLQEKMHSSFKGDSRVGIT